MGMADLSTYPMPPLLLAWWYKLAREPKKIYGQASKLVEKIWYLLKRDRIGGLYTMTFLN
ncbi:hypothetical protein HMF3257_13785 [Spirosoma telluris]|uniref:Uncharacterized protein n=1 Tax=Spirosoma telluris TaxID=2183553 RepID=A0A327NIP3_9BACT|nr:hypothetical protein HMF3257_13785 [Spirosoma telluris]